LTILRSLASVGGANCGGGYGDSTVEAGSTVVTTVLFYDTDEQATIYLYIYREREMEREREREVQYIMERESGLTLTVTPYTAKKQCACVLVCLWFIHNLRTWVEGLGVKGVSPYPNP